MTNCLLDRYRGLAASGEIADDPAQALAVEKLQLLANRLVSYKPPARTDFFSFFTRRSGEVPKGLYIFGGVGRGKTMLMNMFFETAPLTAKRRLHFHAFMAEVHGRIARARAAPAGKNGDAVSQAAAGIAAETRLLCLDELFVTDIADATILSRLFSGFFAAGLVVVTTSNVPPAQLYKDGRNRDLFLPFIALVEDHMEVLELSAQRDYRQDKMADMPLYYVPADALARERMDLLWRGLAGEERDDPAALTVAGRVVTVPAAASGMARFSFADLCEAPLGAADYLEIARRFHTVFIDRVPVLTPEKRNAARRFITLIDTLYDNRVGLVISAGAEPGELYVAGDGADHFERTASRLTEMRARVYFDARPASREAAAAAAAPE
jgi:cell division protein ZapE